MVIRVADPHNFNADLDTFFLFTADPDPNFHFNADLARQQNLVRLQSLVYRPYMAQF